MKKSTDMLVAPATLIGSSNISYPIVKNFDYDNLQYLLFVLNTFIRVLASSMQFSAHLIAQSYKTFHQLSIV